MAIKKSMGERVFSVCNVLILLLLSVVTLYPFLHVIFSSFSDPAEYLKHTGLILHPLGFSLDAYKAVFEKPEIWTGYANTLFYVGVGTCVNMILTVSLAFTLSREHLYWNKILMKLIIFTMYFNGGLIPTDLLVQNMGMVDTRWAMIFPSAIVTFNLIVMINGFKAVPVSLEEAAKIDGASPMVIMARIILPLSMPTVAVIILYYGVQRWNEWFPAMVYLRSDKNFPLQLVLRQILIENQQGDMVQQTQSADKLALAETIKHATIIVSTIPILILYPFLQKYFTQGVMIGAVKG